MIDRQKAAAFQVLETPAIGIPTASVRSTRWLQVLSHVSPHFGGIAASVPQLAKATEAEGLLSCPIACFCDREELNHIPKQEQLALQLFPAGRKQWIFDSTARSRFKRAIRESDGVHIHGLWETHSIVAARLARASKRSYVVSAHGMLDPWALRHKRLKKALYGALIEKRVLQGAACLRALTLDEVDDYRSLGFSNPIAVIPGGVEVPESVTAELFYESQPELRDKRLVIFLGRLHPKKRIPMLLEAWANTTKPEDAHLLIAGPDSDGMAARLEQTVADLNIGSSVTFLGMLTGKRKWSALAASELFVLPSVSEGFSIAVLEALAMGLPALISQPCHFPEVSQKQCGWVIPPEEGPLGEALDQFFHLSASERVRMGQRARDLVNQRFHWSVVGRQMSEVYNWIAGGPKPQEVTIV